MEESVRLWKVANRRESEGVWATDCQARQQIINVAVAQIESLVEPDSVADDVWREVVALDRYSIIHTMYI